MRPKWVLMALMTMVFLATDEWYHSCYGCLEQERIGLSQLKASFNHPNGTSLEGWLDSEDDCYKWHGVECNNITRKVTKLSLIQIRDRRLRYWFINVSLFQPFKELTGLNLAWNYLNGCSENQGFGALSPRLMNLQVLNLSFNNFDDSILACLSGLSSLKSLDLARNRLTGSHTNELGTLSNLEELDLNHNQLNLFKVPKGGLGNLEVLDLSYNFLESFTAPKGSLNKLKVLDLGVNWLQNIITFEGALSNLEVLNLGANGPLKFMDSKDINGSIKQGPILPSLKTISVEYGDFRQGDQVFYNMSNLEDLYLFSSLLPTNFLQRIGALSTLKALSLSESHLNGTLPARGWCELKNLEELSFLGNKLEGPLPACMGNLSSLRLLELSSNQFEGNIASSPLTNLTLLEYLSFSSNNFHVPISLKSFIDHSNLKILSGDNNKLEAEPTIQTFTPKFQLRFFSLSNCSSKELIGELPTFLYSQYELRYLDLSINYLRGKFPSWLFKNNTRLRQILLSNNSFTGSLQLPYYPNPNLHIIDISKNHIDGPIPTHICLIFPNLLTLMMVNNTLTGSVPPCFGNVSRLYYLDLSNNQLSGGITEQLAIGLSSIEFVKLSHNYLGGQISPSIFNSTNLKFLYLGSNNFVGKIPYFSSNKSSLWALHISDNHLSGMLPRWIRKMSDLQVIDFSKNQFEGPIPVEFCKLHYLEFLDLSANNLTGSIPSCFNWESLSHVHLNRNQLSSPLTHTLCNCPSLVTLDLSYNYLTGPIPNCIGDLPRLSVVLLKANHFDGGFPVQLCSLQQLSILDLSQNDISGPLPSCLSNLTFNSTSKTAVFRSSMEFESIGDLYLESLGIAKLPQIELDLHVRHDYLTVQAEEGVEFTTKRLSQSYKGRVLNLMSGVDLSSNKFSGEIPQEIGNLTEIRALNLSHNIITGSIPTTFSNLKHIESLDLSHNKLSGRIPPQLTELNFLAVFSVAYNNLSGKTPERKAQFGTFDESSYEGNPLLCGPPLLHDNSTKIESPSPPMSKDSNSKRDDTGFMDMQAFYATFGGSYIIVLLGIAAVLYINPYWRRAWFYYIEVLMETCYYFVLDHFHKLCNFK